MVTGGAGFVGSHLVEELLRRGYRVQVVDDLSSGSLQHLDVAQQIAAAAHSGELSVTVADVGEPRVAEALALAADVVFHLAGAVGVRRLAADPVTVMQRNLRPTEAVVTACSAAATPLLLASSSEVYGDGPVPFAEGDPVRPGATEGMRGGYACAKAMGEWLAMAHAEQRALPLRVARLFNTVGPRQSMEAGMVLPRFVRQAMRGEPLTVYGGGTQTRCFAHVGEVVRALADLAESARSPARVINVGSAVETTVRELAELVRDRAGSRSTLSDVPFDAVFPTGFVDPPRRVPSLRRLALANGWVPTAPLAGIVEELLALARSEAGCGGPTRSESTAVA